MSKRKWTNIRALEGLIIEMRKSGKTRQEIADALGLEKEQIKNWVSRYNRMQAKMEAGLPPKRRGRPRKKEMTSEEEYKYEIRRLKMENELLRDFLSLTGRK
jgi:transposase